MTFVSLICRSLGTEHKRVEEKAFLPYKDKNQEEVLMGLLIAHHPSEGTGPGNSRAAPAPCHDM